MTTSNEQYPYFAHALEGRQDITASYEFLGDLPARVGVSTQNEDIFIAQVRRIIENHTDGTVGIASTAASDAGRAEAFTTTTASALSMEPMQ